MEVNLIKYLKIIDEVIENGYFKDNWDSLMEFEVPAWYKKAKFGIFIHWGLYSVPEYSNEWYSRNMYTEGMPAFEHHVETFGKQKDFGYKDFIPMFTAKKFDPKEWAKAFKESGAKYVFPVAEHHDGFQMYKSSISHFNAYEMGPKRDVLGELKKAVEQEGLAFCTSSHRAEHWFFMGNGKKFESDIKEPLQRGDFYWPAMPEPDFQDLFSEPYPTVEFLQDWLIRTCEIVDEYKPKLLYFDWWIQHKAFKPYLRKLIAYYYNRGLEWGEPVAVCYKHDALMFGSGIVEVERGKFAEPKPYYWQTDTAVAKNSWCYTDSLDYKTSVEIICDLIDIVSKNGNMLLNIGPRADGTIPDRDTQILKDIGAWLKVNGEAIYNTKVWRKSSEGPTKEIEGQFSDNEAQKYTSEDIRFTVAGNYLYATVLNYPEDGKVIIKSLAESVNQNVPEFHGIISSVCILGFDENPIWKQNTQGLFLETKTVKSDKPVVFKIEIN